MKLYHDLTQCSFLYRVNRFIAKCLVNGTEITVHVKNTGRLKELLRPGALCWLEKAGNPNRKTPYDLIAVEKDGRIVNIDSQAANLIAREWVENGGWIESITRLQSEYTFGDSRYDMAYWTDASAGETNRRPGGLIEVKGVTLFDESGAAYFPDAPTARGTKHLRGLISAKQSGMETGVCFVILNEDAVCLIPNSRTDPDFSAALKEAHDAGVRIEAAICRVTPEGAEIVGTIPVRL